MIRYAEMSEKLNYVMSTFRQIAQELMDLKAKHAETVETNEMLVRDLCRALDRAQEIIVMIGEKSGNEELLKEARIYANAIGGAVDSADPKPPVHYSENPVIKKYWEKLAKTNAPKTKKGKKS